MSNDQHDTNSRQHHSAYRILDANLNRCTEGLRVVEEYARFFLEDAHLSSLCKQLRHDLIEQTAPIRSQLQQMRDVVGDVGTNVSTDSEYRRVDLKDVAAANLKRIEQSLRSMEEYTKVVAPDLAAAFESLRYRSYTIERSMSLLERSSQRLASAHLYVLIDGRKSLNEFRQLVDVLISAGVDVLQLRDKQLTDLDLLERARLLRAMTRDQDVLFVMNDRVDLAIASGADGVHVGQDELPPREARRLIGPEALIGVSTHCIDQARRAVLDGANYIGCGPTFPSSTKSFESFPGLDYLREVSQEISLPAFAIGGINIGNIDEVCSAGMTRVAVAGAVVDQPDPGSASRKLKEKLRQTS